MSDQDDREAVGELRRIIGANDNNELAADTLSRVCLGVAPGRVQAHRRPCVDRDDTPVNDAPLFAAAAPTATRLADLTVSAIDARTAAATVVEHHYLHRRPPISYAYGVYSPARFAGVDCSALVGVATFGTPASRHLQMGACPSDPGLVVELNRVWLADGLPPNAASWFVSRALRALPPRIVVSYADTGVGHVGYMYRALNFRYAGRTDDGQATPRRDSVPRRAGVHSRDAYRSGGPVGSAARSVKLRYWTVTGSPSVRRRLVSLCGWPSLPWGPAVAVGVVAA